MKVLIAGIGNIFMGDDAFGCAVAQHLFGNALPPEVEVVDFGIRGMDLGYALMGGGYDLVILLDVVQRGGAPGTLYLIEPELGNGTLDSSGEQVITPHSMDPASVLKLVASLGAQRPRVLLVGCEPEYLGGEEGYMGLSETVGAAIAPAAAQVLHVIATQSADHDRHVPAGLHAAEATVSSE